MGGVPGTTLLGTLGQRLHPLLAGRSALSTTFCNKLCSRHCKLEWLDLGFFCLIPRGPFLHFVWVQVTS